MADLIDILDRTESLSTSKEMQYSLQQGIIGKASLAAGAENLKRFPLKIKLHRSFCTPSDVIEEIEDKISSSEIIDYFQGSVYIGKYVITRMDLEVAEIINGTITSCEINLELLEAGEDDEEFSRQTINSAASALEGNTDSSDTFSSLSAAVSAHLKAQGANIKTSAVNAVSEMISNLDFSSGTARITAQGITDSIISDITSEGISNVSEITDGYLEHLDISALEDADAQTLTEAISSIPDTVLDNCLRG